MKNSSNNKLLNQKFMKDLYLNKGFILIDIFIIIAIVQYFIFEGSFNRMVDWFKSVFNYLG